MSVFFLIVEIFIYGFTYYLFAKKKELSVIYFPVIFFCFSVITPVFPLVVFYGAAGFIILSVINTNYRLLRENIFSILIFIYYCALLTQASETLKFSLVYNVLFFFISLPLINLVYKKYTRDVVFKELTNCAAIVLVIFIINVILASVTRYSNSMYGISGGVLYGNLETTDLNIVGIALFVLLLSILKKSNIVLIAIYVAAIAFILLTLRRSAMLASILGIPFAFLSILTQKSAQKVFLFMIVSLVLGAGVYYNTDFASVFKQRYELRNLDERELEEEKRFFEYEILYYDMFISKEYSPIFGYGLFDSAGNYGKGIFDDRTIHADIPSIAHSSGILGVILYLLMITTAFYKAFRASNSKLDTLIVLYCFIIFGLYTITGRYSQVDTMLLLFLTVNLSLAKSENEEAPTDKNVVGRAAFKENGVQLT